MSDRVPMTQGGYARLQAEAKRLKSEERPAIVKEIETARAHGDLSENAEYHAAKERQGLLDGEKRRLEDKIGRADVIDPSKLSGDKVVFGATVDLVNIDSDEESFPPRYPDQFAHGWIPLKM